MKKISATIAFIMLFAGITFASSYQVKADKAKTEKKADKKKEVKKVPARKTVTKAKTTAAPKSTTTKQ